MKTSMIVLFVLVSLSLVFSIFSFIIIISNFDLSHVQVPQILSKPTPTSRPQNTVDISYSELSREAIVGNNTRLILSVNLTYVQGDTVTLNYTQFALRVFVPRGGIIPAGEGGMLLALTNPIENGSATVGKADMATTFQLKFEFPTYGGNFDNPEVHFSGYQLEYTGGQATVQWANQ